MKKATNELLNNKNFVDFLYNNFLYTNRPSFFKKHVTVLQYHKHFTQKYLQKTLTSLLKLPPFTPSSTSIVYIYPLVFLIRQVIRLLIRTPSEVFWIRTYHKLDTFLDIFQKLPVYQQIIQNSEENFHFRIIHEMDYLLRNFNSFFSVMFGLTFI
ncbi:hypothetical protein RIR_jg38142.t1 [Rhizophagus irregularis DAOM 181602=DAOM 197198]|uniref:Uncharacterized protein n=1 Tax=Rhizophagus irregularis (strain DAOM 181602 / DAOM 197198 / MUCL 43194) TaxID=747089 RepID=U9UM67_RHIID|nr:hypothetical protein RIR_jg38142.t1 [Rhizophagus irregularis DAOM 181602=DAOM 197198]